MRKVVVNIKDQGILAERPGLLAENQNPLFIGFLACVFFLKMYSVEALYMIASVVQVDLSAASTCGQNLMMNKVLPM